jgi:hypothetical protein
MTNKSSLILVTLATLSVGCSEVDARDRPTRSSITSVHQAESTSSVPVPCDASMNQPWYGTSTELAVADAWIACLHPDPRSQVPYAARTAIGATYVYTVTPNGGIA